MASRPPSNHDHRRAGRAFLASAALGALNTANGRKPLARNGGAGVLAFATGYPTSEMPLHALGWQALATVGFARRGAFRSPAGLAGLGLSLVSWMTLVRMWRESLNTGALMESALRDGLGDDLDLAHQPVAPDFEAPTVRRRLVRGPAGLAETRARYVARGETNISYGPAGPRNQLDIWRRPDLPADGRAPVILQVHGGGWVIGNKQQQAMPLLAHLAERGWIGVSINYRLSPRATWPDHIIDVKRALAWVKANIASYGGDPDFVAITGGSAGGHLSSLAALSANEAEFQPGFEEADTSVVAAVPFYGVYDWVNRDGTGRADMEPVLARLVLKSKLSEARDVWEFASTMTWVRPDAPPFMVIHGSNDTLVPVEQARSFVSMLRAESKKPVVYVELPGAQHAYELFDSPRTLFTLDAVDRFLETVRVQEGHMTKAEAEAADQAP
ncbi:MAG: alpha/beta hydrolase [Microthrixaceae bacterium]|nr:alpha/beta hydrolase [Acidimicrobiales bacterium]MCB9404170.1 alpha/beta hydrolase [Microthrixaceae bacterium]